MDRKCKVGIVVVNWNDYDNLVRLVRSVETTSYQNTTLYIVDNGSTDVSLDSIRRTFPQYRLIANERNLGFSGGYNVGVQASLDNGDDAVFLVNSDIVLEPECLTRLVAAFDRRSNVGIVCGKVYYADRPEVIWAAGGVVRWPAASFVGRGIREPDRQQYDQEVTVNYAPGAAFLVKRAVFDAIGLLPECYFIGGEEVDFSAMARRRGYETLYVPDAVSWHKVGYSATDSLKYRYNRMRNRLLFVSRNVRPLPRGLWFAGFRLRHWALAAAALFMGNAHRTRSILRKKALADHGQSNAVTIEQLRAAEQLGAAGEGRGL